MPKLDIEKIKRASIVIFHTKDVMLKYIKKVGFNNQDSLVITRYNKKWFVRWE